MNTDYSQSLQRDTAVSSFTRGLVAISASLASSFFLVAVISGKWGYLLFAIAGLYWVFRAASGSPLLNEYRVFMTETKLQVFAWAIMASTSVALVLNFASGAV